MTHAVITGTGLYTPPHAIDNATLVASFNAWVDRENARYQEAIEDGWRQPLEHCSSEFIAKATFLACPNLPKRDMLPDMSSSTTVAHAAWYSVS